MSGAKGGAGARPRSIARPIGPFVAEGTVRVFDTTLRDG